MQKIEKVTIRRERAIFFQVEKYTREDTESVQIIRSHLYNPYIKQIRAVYGCTDTQARAVARRVMDASFKEVRTCKNLAEVEDYFFDQIIKEAAKELKYDHSDSLTLDYDMAVKNLLACSFTEDSAAMLAKKSISLLEMGLAEIEAENALQCAVFLTVRQHLIVSLQLKENDLRILSQVLNEATV